MMFVYRPLFLAAIFFALGIAFSSFKPLTFVFILALGFLGAGAWVLRRWASRWFRKVFFIWVALATLSFGYFYTRGYHYCFRQDHLADSLPFGSGAVTVKGQVLTVESQPRKQVGVLQINFLQQEDGWWVIARGKVRFQIYQDLKVYSGDYLTARGKLHRPFDFDPLAKSSYRDYLANRGIYWILSVKKSAEVTVEPGPASLGGLRDRFLRRLGEGFDRYLDPFTAGMTKALVLGLRQQIPKELKEAFNHTGTTHILAISGFNVGIVVFGVMLVWSLLRFSRKAQLWATMVFLVVFAWLTGSQPPVVRATIMAIVYLLSFIVERPPDALNSWGAAALILLVSNPFNLFDVGFQLSFLSVLSILWLAQPLLEKMLTRNDANAESRLMIEWARQGWRALVSTLAVSLTAWVGVLGLVAYYFGIITPIGVLANLVVIPLASLLIVLGMGYLSVVFWWPWMAENFAVCLEVVGQGLVAAVNSFERCPGAYWLVPEVSVAQTYAYYLFFVLALVLFQRRKSSVRP